MKKVRSCYIRSHQASVVLEVWNPVLYRGFWRWMQHNGTSQWCVCWWCVADLQTVQRR